MLLLPTSLNPEARHARLTSVQLHRSKFMTGSDTYFGYHIVIIIFRWLKKHPNYDFKLIDRDPSFLPKEYIRVRETDTCYFLDSYKQPTLDPSLPLQFHIESAMKQIAIDSKN